MLQCSLNAQIQIRQARREENYSVVKAITFKQQDFHCKPPVLTQVALLGVGLSLANSMHVFTVFQM